MGRRETTALRRLIPVALSVTVVMWLISTAVGAVPNADAPDALVTPQLLPHEPLTVDGNRLEVC